MTFADWDYMTPDRQLFPRSIAEALADLLRQRYRTAKQLAKAVGIDVSTAENLHKGHLSVPTLQKVMQAEGRGLWDKLGDELFGETFYQFEERRLAAAIREAESARSNLVRLRAQGEELLARAAHLDEALAGPPSPAHRDAPGGARVEHDPRSGSQAAHAGEAPLEGRSFAERGGR